MIRAVWVPEGAALPGYPYEHIGQAVFIPDSDDRNMPAVTSRRNPSRMSPSRTARLSDPSRTDETRAQEDNARDGRRWSGSPFASAAGPWAPPTRPIGGNGSSGGSAARRGVRSAQANFSAAVPTPHLDASRDAIGAAVRALGVKPSDGIVPISADRINVAGSPTPPSPPSPAALDSDGRSIQPASDKAANRTFEGDATSYNLVGNKTASGAPFDPAAMTGAMFPGRVPLGTSVTVRLRSDPNRSVVITINDTGPFLRGTDGRAVLPYQPDPHIVVDLTPAAMQALTGLSFDRVAVTVTVEQ